MKGMQKLKGVINVLKGEQAHTTWFAPKAKPERAPPSTRQLPKSILLTEHFKRWSAKPYGPESPNPSTKSVMPGLDANVFAQMLASPVRIDKLAEVGAPKDLLIRLGLIQPDEENKPSILQPFVSSSKQVVERAKGYIGLHETRVQMLQKPGLINQVCILMLPQRLRNSLSANKSKKSSKGPLFPFNSDNSYHDMLVDEITVLLRQVVGNPSKITTAHYVISFKTDVSVRVEYPQNSEPVIAQFNLPKIFGKPSVTDNWQTIVGGDVLKVPATRSGASRQLVALIWKYNLFTA